MTNRAPPFAGRRIAALLAATMLVAAAAFFVAVPNTAVATNANPLVKSVSTAMLGATADVSLPTSINDVSPPVSIVMLPATKALSAAVLQNNVGSNNGAACAVMYIATNSDPPAPRGVDNFAKFVSRKMDARGSPTVNVFSNGGLALSLNSAFSTRIIIGHKWRATGNRISAARQNRGSSKTTAPNQSRSAIATFRLATT